ncbi:hypothetical protein ILYODFUR_007937 [Ilyodon furcidens]|uniref:Uncharacterized protein n=1 Tax=Ilyodon furcidens TaxID=33524 RepID=A0ABV0TKH0_9TELE
MKHVCPLTLHHFSHLHLEEGTRKSFPLNATHHHLPISVSLLAFLLWNSTISPARPPGFLLGTRKKHSLT